MTAKILPPKKVDPKTAAKKRRPKTSEDRAEETIRISVTIAPDAQPGQRELRIITPGGVSNRFRFLVGPIREIAEKEPNSKKDQAQPLGALPVVVNGQVVIADGEHTQKLPGRLLP